MAEQRRIVGKLDTTHFGSGLVFSNSDLTINNTSATDRSAQSIARLSRLTGKHYFEVLVDRLTGVIAVGVKGDNLPIGTLPPGHSVGAALYATAGVAAEKRNNATETAYGNAPTVIATDVIGVAYDADNAAIWFSVNGSWIDGDGTDSSATVLAEIEAGTTTSAAYTSHTAATSCGFTPHLGVNDGQLTLREATGDWTGSAPAGFSGIASDGAAWNTENSQLTSMALKFDLNSYGVDFGTNTATVICHWGTASGKYHWEIAADTVAAAGPNIGIYVGDPVAFNSNTILTSLSGAYVIQLGTGSTSIFENGSSTQTGLAAVVAGSIISVEFDADLGELSFYDDGVQLGATITGITAGTAYPVLQGRGATVTLELNTGRSAFSMTPTSGFEAVDEFTPTVAVELPQITPRFDTQHIGTSLVLSNSDRTVNNSSATDRIAQSITRWDRLTKRYVEFVVDRLDGLISLGVKRDAIATYDLLPASSAYALYIQPGIAALKKYGGTNLAYGNAPIVEVGDVIGVAYDGIDTGSYGAIYMSVNGVWIDGNGTDDSATVLAEIEVNNQTSALSGTTSLATTNTYYPFAYVNDAQVTIREEPSQWTYPPPSGYSDEPIYGGSWDVENSPIHASFLFFSSQYSFNGISETVGAPISHWSTSSGKYHWEIYVPTVTSTSPTTGIFIGSSTNFPGTSLIAMSGAYVFRNAFSTASKIYADGVEVQGSLPTVLGGSYISVEFDADLGELSFYDDGVQLGTTIIVPAGTAYIVHQGSTGTTRSILNSGREAFTMTPTTGFAEVDIIPPTVADGAVELNLAVTSTASNPVKHLDGGTSLNLAVTSTASNPVKHLDGGTELNLAVAGTATKFAVLNADGAVDFNLAVAGTATKYKRLNADGAVALNLAVASTATNPAKHADGITALNLAVSGTATKFEQLAADGAVALNLAVASTATHIPTFRGNTSFPLLTLDGVYDTSKVFVGDGDIPVAEFTGDLAVGELISGGITLPSLEIDGAFASGFTGTLPALTSTGQMQSGTISKVNRTIPRLTITGSFSKDEYAALDKKLPRLRSVGTIAAGGVLVSAATLREMEVSGTILTGTVSTLMEPLPGFIVTATHIGEGLAILDEALPLLRIFATLINNQALTASSYSLNTENFGLAEYENYDFLYLGQYMGKFYGVKADGIYELSGPDDSGTNIDASFATGLSDLGTENLKRVTKAYIGYTADGDMDMSIVIDGESAPRTYELRREKYASGIKNARVPLSRGVKSRYWKIGLQNKLGADFEVDMISLLPELMSRKT